MAVMEELDLKHKKLIYVPLIGMVYMIYFIFKNGLLVKCKNINIYESLLSVLIQSFSMALISIILTTILLLN